MTSCPGCVPGAYVAHPRKLVRDAVVALLTNATSAGSRVFPTRIEPIRKAQLPAIAVYTLSEESAPETDSAPRELARIVRVEIAGFVAHTNAIPVDDAMDALAEQIESAMDADRYLDGAAYDSVLEGTELQVREDDARSDPLLGIITLTYAVEYRTTPVVGSLDDFLTASTSHQVVGGIPGDTVPAEDEFIVQEST